VLMIVTLAVLIVGNRAVGLDPLHPAS
jgi:hypothetical protein